MAACGLSEAIQNLPTELRERILKEYIPIKIKEKKEMGLDKVHKHIPKPGWDKVNRHISKLPFCKYRQQIVPMVTCFEYADCFFESCCYPCFERDGNIHKASLNPPIIPFVEATPEYKNFFKQCSGDGYDWHGWFLFGRER